MTLSPSTETERFTEPAEPPDATGAVGAGPRRGAWLAAAAPEALVLVATAVLNLWALGQNGLGNPYYAAAVRSMSGGWHEFVFGSYDPGGWITTDKPPFPYWVAAMGARVFGVSSWSLLLPSAIAGAVTVALLMATVRPLWGRWAAVVAGAALALTPAALAVARSNNPDGILLTLVVAAAWATARALRDGRSRWLVIAGALVGLAFLTKLLAGFIVLPALWLAYLVAGPGSSWRRSVQLVAGTVAVVVVAGAWVALVDLTPLDERPFIGGSRDGSALDLVLGYNGLGRVLGQDFDSDSGLPSFPGGGMFPVGSDGIDQFGGAPGAGRLFNNGMGDQIMWLLAPALIAGSVALVEAARRRDRPRTGTLVAFVTWLGLTAAVYSTAKGIFHNYYVSYLAPPLAALVGIGVARVLDLARSHATGDAGAVPPAPGRNLALGMLRGEPPAREPEQDPPVDPPARGRSAAVALAVGLAAAIPLQLVLLDRVAAWEWLRIAVPAGLAVAAALLLAGVLVRHAAAARLPVAGALAGVIVVLAAPAAWSVSALQRPANPLFPDARPVPAVFAFPGMSGGPGGSEGPSGFPGFGSLPRSQLDWLAAQRTTEHWVLAVSASMQASDAIIDGYPVMAMGGFMGADPAMTQERLADLVDRGELRFLTAGGGLPFGGGSAPAVAAQVCTAVPSSTWGGAGAGVLDCRGKGEAIRRATPPAAPAGPGGPGPGGLDVAALGRCLRDRGVEIDPGTMPDFSDPGVASAFQACLPAGGPPGFPGGPGVPGGMPGGGPPGPGFPGFGGGRPPGGPPASAVP